ncbi:dihydropteroate synthase-related protein [Methanobrevibacter olleyae]|uniref:Dihydropteroate synthase-related protein n=1 Tax=Methanobrevibacter olleyae TaxID=294671 RepID=A0A1I4I0I0_METOL|nr:dihydropteroate synthase-like protein [Methanobrevibacter olleyae]SFL47690.1 dihydropteroate synthase-related protein [Methanobrevibacter olleyae]
MILIITGHLAYPLVKEMADKSSKETVVHIAETQIAAFLTPNQIIKEIHEYFSDRLDDIDLILVPGLIRKDTFLIAEEFKIPCYKASTDAADLAMVLDLVDDLELSQSTPADKLIIEEKKKQALKFIEDFENDMEKRDELLKKENNILVRNLPVGEDFPMRVLSEIASAPILSKEELIRKAEFFVASGSDMIDIGMIAGEDRSDEIPDLIDTLRPIVGDRPLSIDTLNPKEIEAAVNHGIDLVLSLDNGNYAEILPLLKEKNVPAVILPTNFSEGFVPHSPEERVESMKKLVSNCEGIDLVCDLILDPVNSASIVDSIISFYDFHKLDKKPMFFGIGNVIELMDTDSVGANALLAGIAMELGASILFTPEESGKTHGSVRELAIASKMMFLAKNRQSIPKDLGIDLLVFKDKRKRFDLKQEDYEVQIVKQEEPMKFIRDKAGSFKIRAEHATSVKDSFLLVTHFKRNQADITFKGKTAREIYEEIIKKGLVTRMEHAAYLGSELQKAEIAILTGKEYVQDFDLFKDPEEFIQ